MFKKFFDLFWNSRNSKPSNLYSVNDDACILYLGLDLYTIRKQTRINLQMMKQVQKEK